MTFGRLRCLGTQQVGATIDASNPIPSPCHAAPQNSRCGAVTASSAMRSMARAWPLWQLLAERNRGCHHLIFWCLGLCRCVSRYSSPNRESSPFSSPFPRPASPPTSSQGRCSSCSGSKSNPCSREHGWTHGSRSSPFVLPEVGTGPMPYPSPASSSSCRLVITIWFACYPLLVFFRTKPVLLPSADQRTPGWYH